ncbi:MAG: hypothetical protein WD187_03240 [Candidatus Woykebacteria bacterium]
MNIMVDQVFLASASDPDAIWGWVVVALLSIITAVAIVSILWSWIKVGTDEAASKIPYADKQPEDEEA